ncbi:MAG: LacI family DNA-binding transcriptional regulator, partial [Pseudomonadota bacterium]
KMTVSRVLRGASGFSDETRDKVLAEVKRLDYVPNRLAAAFGATGASTLVGISVPRLTSPLFGQVLDGVDRALSRLGYQTMIGSHHHSPEDEAQWLRSIFSWRPAGVILSGRQHSIEAIDLIKSAAVPIVEIWDLNTSPIDMSVGFSHFDSGHEMGQFLVQRGYRRIGYVGALAGVSSTGGTRLEGFKAALNAAGVPLAAAEVLHDSPGFYAGYYGLETLLAREASLDAVYFNNDEMAIGGIAYAQAAGISVPGDLGIAGWGGMEASSILPQRLTTTVVPATNIGMEAAKGLVARLRGEVSSDVVVLPTRLAPGETV